MDLDTYHDWAAAEADWFRSRLLEEGVEALRASYAALGEAGVRSLLQSHRSAIDDLLHTPKIRRAAKLRKIPDGTERHAFLIAAAYTVRCGYALLSFATQYGLLAGYGPSRAFLLGQASVVAQQLNADFPTLWPFADEPDPANDE